MHFERITNRTSCFYSARASEVRLTRFNDSTTDTALKGVPALPRMEVGIRKARADAASSDDGRCLSHGSIINGAEQLRNILERRYPATAAKAATAKTTPAKTATAEITAAEAATSESTASESTAESAAPEAAANVGTERPTETATATSKSYRFHQVSAGKGGR